MTGKQNDKTFTFQSLQHFKRIVPEFKVLPVYEQSSNFSNDLWISIFCADCASTYFQILAMNLLDRIDAMPDYYAIIIVIIIIAILVLTSKNKLK